MKTKTILIALIALAVVVTGLVWAFAPRPIDVEVAPVTRGHFQRTVDEDGRTRVLDRYTLSAPIGGVVERIRLREGDLVTADDVVALIVPGPPAMLDARTEQQQGARVRIAEAAVERAESRIERAKVAIEQARNELSRSEKLAQQGFVSPIKLENDRLQLTAAQRDLDTAKQDDHIARHDLEEARAVMRQYQSASPAARAKSWAVRAPVAGRVLRITHTSEGMIAPGAALMEIGDIGRLEVIAEVLTGDALQMPHGTRVLLERWGGPGVLEGRVRMVEPSAFTKVSALGVEEQRVIVRIDITSPRETWRQLGDGFRVNVRVVVEEAHDALRVPVSAVFPLAGKMAVFAVDGNRARVRAVEVGSRNGVDTWIKSGLTEGEQVIAYPPSNVHDGVRLKVRTS
jgi:HlyD family secretion protein